MNVKKFFVFGVFFFCLTSCSFAQEKPDNSRLPQKMIFLSLDNVIVTPKNLPKNEPLLLIYFRPDCGHCQMAGKAIAKYIGQYPDISIWMISDFPDSVIKDYCYSEKLFPAKKLSILQDYTHQMHTWFHFNTVPLMLLFSAKGKLIKEFDMVPAPDELNKILKTTQVSK